MSRQAGRLQQGWGKGSRPGIEASVRGPSLQRRCRSGGSGLAPPPAAWPTDQRTGLSPRPSGPTAQAPRAAGARRGRRGRVAPGLGRRPGSSPDGERPRSSPVGLAPPEVEAQRGPRGSRANLAGSPGGPPPSAPRKSRLEIPGTFLFLFGAAWFPQLLLSSRLNILRVFQRRAPLWAAEVPGTGPR